MAIISSLGVGSNLDLNGLLTQLTGAERLPLKAIDARAASYTTKLSAYGKLQSSLDNLQTTSAKLANLNLFKGVKADSSFTTVLTGTAEATAVAGSYAINVSQLAQAQSLATTGQASSTASVGSGTLTFKIGSGSPTDVTVGASNSLEGIRDAINATKNLGVSASIVNDGGVTPYRLLLVSSKTGEASKIDITVGGGDAALGALMNNNSVDPKTMTETVTAKNAQLTVNGLAITSATNTVVGSIQGVTLSLVKTGDSTLTVGRDTASALSAINAFANNYNSLLNVGKTLTSFDPTSKKGSALSGDSTLRNLQVQLRSALTSPQSGSTGDFTMLSNIGVSFQKDGTLTVDASKLDKALSSNMDGVGKLFAGSATDTAGYGKQLSALALSFTATGGSLKAAAEGLTGSLKQLEKDYAATSTRIDATVARYKAQFTQLDGVMSRMNQTSTYLTAQFASMNSNK